MNLSRRAFARVAGAGAAAAVLPSIAALRPLLAVKSATSEIVRLSANENPYGPSAAALEAMRLAFAQAWRYPDEAQDELLDTIAKLHSVSRDQVLLGDGSSEILKLAAACFTGPSRKVVMASPTFEAIGNYGRAAGAEVVSVPLDAAFAHDVAKMGAVSGTGLLYVCNPNNPTGSITPKEAVRSLIAGVPASIPILVDEAYFHYAVSGDYESVLPAIASHPSLIVARTFSKIYGMAGIRAGFAMARLDLLAKMRPFGGGMLPITGLACATASMKVKSLIAERRAINRRIRENTFEFLEKKGVKYIPSEANFFMMEVGRPGAEFAQAMAAQKVIIGRVWPAWPTKVRVTVGTQDEMDKFKAAYLKVVA